MDGRSFQRVAPAGAHGQQWWLLSVGADARSLSPGTGSRVGQMLRIGVEGAGTESPGQPGGLGLRLALDLTFWVLERIRRNADSPTKTASGSPAYSAPDFPGQ